jgi:hypothetical protein
VVPTKGSGEMIGQVSTVSADDLYNSLAPRPVGELSPRG